MTYDTHGFDIVVEISERELNDQLTIQYINGEIPQAVDLTQSIGDNNFILNLLLDEPRIDLHSDIVNGINLTIPFHYSSIEITCRNLTSGELITTTAEPVEGEIQISDQISVQPVGNLRRTIIDFTDGINDVKVSFTPETDTLIQNNFGNCGITPTILRLAFEQGVRDFFQNDIQEFILDETQVNPDINDPLIPIELAVQVISDETRFDGDCIANLLTTRSTSVGDPSAFTHSAIPSGKRLLIMISSNLIIQMICDELAPALSLSSSDFNCCPCELNHSIVREGVTIKTLRVSVTNGYFKIRATFEKSGSGYSAEGSFEVRVYLVLRNGEIVPEVISLDPDVEVDVAWWVYAVGAFLGGVLFGPLVAVINLIIIGITDALVDGLAVRLAETFTGQLTGDFDLPLGELSEGITLEEIVVETNAVALIGSPNKEEIPIRSQGFIELWLGQSLNLDNGEVHTPTNVLLNRGTFWGEQGLMTYLDDIAWEETYLGSGIWPQGIAYLKIIGASLFETLTPIELEHAFSYWEDVIKYDDDTCVPSEIIPYRTMFFPGVFSPGLNLAVRAGSGRYAKCQVWRDLNTPKLYVQYVTYPRGYISPGPPSNYHNESIFDVIPELEIIQKMKEKHEEGDESYFSHGSFIEKSDEDEW